MRGSYAVYNSNSAALEYSSDMLSFGFQFSAPLTAIWVTGGPVTHCSGSAANPTADPGYLCVYEKIVTNVTGRLIEQPESTGTYGTSGRWGALLFAEASAAGNAYSIGTWAATPAAGSSAAAGHSLSNGPVG